MEADKHLANNIPVHLGLILDGNRRWAKAQGLTPVKGHKAGYANLKNIVTEAFDRGVKYISAYVFSVENWGRSKEEVDYLMKLLLWVAKNEINQYHKQNVRVVFIGEKDRLSDEILKHMKKAEDKTKDNSGGTLVICLNYSGKAEIVAAVNAMLRVNPKVDRITVEQIADNIYQSDVPDVDLIIRTSGEQRISNFMLWRAAYSELYFCETNWPDFGPADLDLAFEDFTRRQRRFGKG